MKLVMIGLVTCWAVPTLLAQEKFSIQGTYQIEKGKRHGWLILNVKVPEGSHIYALTQKGNPPPTKIKLAESKQFKLLTKFQASKKPKVVEHDPIFDQRVEKHEGGKVAFMAPIRVADQVDLASVEFDVKINCQLCNDSGCKIYRKPVEVEFAGFYESDKKKKRNEETGDQ